jgi:hypothetical protein
MEKLWNRNIYEFLQDSVSVYDNGIVEFPRTVPLGMKCSAYADLTY